MGERARVLVIVLFASAAAVCAPHEEPPPRDATTTTTSAALMQRAEPIALVTVQPRGDTRLPWAADLLGAKPPVVRINVRNSGTAQLDVADLHATLEATRGDVTFRCVEDDLNVGREASVVMPGEAATFDRAFACDLPLAGDYDAWVIVSFGTGDARTDQRRIEPSFGLTVVAPRTYQPRAIPFVPGLWSAAGTGLLQQTVSSKRGHALLEVMLVNGTANDLTIPPLDVALRVDREGVHVSCNETPVRLHTPQSLGPGHSFIQTIDVECIGLGESGQYAILARVEGGGESVSLGHLPVDVTTDPMRIDPTRGLLRRNAPVTKRNHWQ